MTGHPTDDELLDFGKGLDGTEAIGVHVDACWRCRLLLAELAVPHPFAMEPPTRIGFDPLVGQTVGAWVLKERLEEGGSGLIYRAEEKLTQRPVVVKLLPPHLMDEPKLKQRMLREARAVNLIRHPNVVNIFAVGEIEQAGIYLVMPLLDGDTLADLLRSREPVAVASVESVLAQTLDALAAAHAAGVVHRDVKPENLFVAPREGGWKVTLIDFGFARELKNTRLTAPNVLIGTPGYMAPEQLKGDEATPASDVYALGVVAFEALAGRPPFEGSSQLDVMQAHLDAPVPSVKSVRKDVPAALDALVTRMLAKAPEARPTAAQALEVLTSPPTLKEGTVPDPSLLITSPVKPSPLVTAITPSPIAPKAGSDVPAIAAGLVIGALAALGLFWLLR
jgi:serine/threonine-protein kinase